MKRIYLLFFISSAFNINAQQNLFINRDEKILCDSNQIGNIIDGVDSSAITTNFPIDNTSNLSVTITDNTVTVVSGGESVTATIDNPEEGTTIEDSEGNLYAVDGSGNVTQIGHSGNKDEGSNSTDIGFSTKDFDTELAVTFENSGKWALDNYEEPYEGSKFANEYEEINNVRVPWKFVPIGKPDKIRAKVTKGNVDLNNLVFKTPTGTEFFAEKNGDALDLTLIGAKQRDGYEVYAVYKENDSTTHTLGKVNIASYPLISRKVTIVPMQGGSVDKGAIEDAINKIYKPYGITWTVTIDEIFNDRSWDTDNNGLKATGTEFYSAFTDEMRALNSAYSSLRGLDKESVYLFWFAEKAEGEAALDGDMPLESRFGYIFSPKLSDSQQTVAHELAHGVFQLRHTFSNKYNIEKSSTSNLMDYNGGSELKKYQWDVIHDPGNMLFAWAQDEEEGASLRDERKIVYDHIEKFRCGYINEENVHFYVERPGLRNDFTAKEITLGDGTTYKYIGFRMNCSLVDIGMNFTPGKVEASKPYSSLNVDYLNEDIVSFAFHDNRREKDTYIIYVNADQAEQLQKYLFTESISDYSSQINNFFNTCLDFDNGIFIEILNNLPECAFSSISADNVVKLFAKLSEESMNDGGPNKISEEKLAIKILQGCNNSSDLINKFKLENSVLPNIDYRFNDIEYVTKDNNYGAFVKELIQQMKNVKEANGEVINDKISIDITEETRVYRIKDPMWLLEKQDKTFWQTDGDLMIFLHHSIGGDIEEKYFLHDIDDWVVIYFEEDIPELEIKKGEIKTMPAYLLHYLIQREINEDTRTSISVAIDITSMFFAFGELRVTKSVIREALAFSDLLASITNIPITALEGKISELPGGAEFVHNYRIVTGLIAIIDVSSSAPDGIYKLKQLAESEIISIRNFFKNYGEALSDIDTDVAENAENISNFAKAFEGFTSGETRVTRSLEEIVPDGIIPPNSKINNKFHEWFDDLTEEELDLVLADPDLYEQLADKIRYPGKLHEWCMVCHVKKFKQWNVPMSEIHRFRTLTAELTWKVPDDITDIGGQLGKHGGIGSGTFHNELKKIIYNSNTIEEFNTGLEQLIIRWEIKPELLPPLIKL